MFAVEDNSRLVSTGPFAFVEVLEWMAWPKTAVEYGCHNGKWWFQSKYDTASDKFWVESEGKTLMEAGTLAAIELCKRSEE